MNLLMDQQLTALLHEIKQLAPHQKVYLVGGAVRDLVLGRAVKDLDFVTADGSVTLAKSVKRHFRGVWYTLDDEHQTARVILKQGQPEELVLDFTAFIGNSLEEDLSQRDFTINAMAVDLDNLAEIFDPLGGETDLRSRKLRLSSPRSLLTDPLRVLRGVRMIREFDLAVNDETAEQLRVAAMELNRISGERIRDELLKSLAIPNLLLTCDLLNEYGVLSQLRYRVFGIKDNFPDTKGDYQKERVLPTENTSPLNTLEMLLQAIDIGNGEAPFFTQCPSRISSTEILQGLKHHLEESLQGGRTRKQLLILFSLFFWNRPAKTADPAEKSELPCINFAEQLSNALMLGQKEQKFLDLVCRGYQNLLLLCEETVEPLEIYRYFRQTGSFGLEGALLHIVNACKAGKKDGKIKLLTETVILTWFQNYDTIVDPPCLIDGEILQNKLYLKPGPDFGLYLESVREAQVIGEVKNQDEAMVLIAQLIKEGR